ncbi:MAG: DUF4340 domain-containing protein [Syntrophobacteraceae bacterium]
MKWRNTAIYFLVLLLIGGIYLVKEKKQEKAAREEKESKRVFTFDAQGVKEIELRFPDAKAIHLEKGEKWRISQPISSDVDMSAFSDFFTALGNIELERKIAKSSDNPGAFGLDKPSLVVRVLAGSDWLELQVGGKNPSESSRYARAGEGGDVFMLSSGTYDNLNKGLRDLRKKELFSWQPDDVSAVDVKWRSGEELSLDRQDGAPEWKSANQPDVRIKARKVRNLLDELHWLRAVDFEGKAEKDAMPSGVLVDVKLKLKDGQTSELKVADPDQVKKQVVAASSEIEGPVRIAPHVLSAIPKSAASLADRSLISSDAADIREITWKTEGGSGNLVWIDRNSWGTKEGNAGPTAVENSRPIRVFLAEMDNAEYIEAVEPSPNPPEAAPNTVQFVDAVGGKSSLTWDKLPSDTANPVTVSMERNGAARAVTIRYEAAKRLDQSLAEMAAGAKGKQ